MAARNTVRTREERRALLENMSLAERKALQRKARAFAAFAGSRWSSEDLCQMSLLAALEGRPAWRTTQSLSDYCETVMANRVGFSGPRRVGKRE
jgi:DNA-directed RNA polymerase specialized sigma24 family protein